jgi:D-alanyl-D-alanine carboxypeptidase/D-alanyl-D-alanine-endopeptidase (penicillin-binding protein 4)
MTGHLPGAGEASSPSATPSETGSPTPTPTPAGPVLAAPSSTAPTPAPAALAAVLDPLIAAPALGPGATAVVLDAQGGALLYNHAAADARTPASTAKVVTAAAALTTLPTDKGLRTAVVTGASDRNLVLVGGGDAMLTARPQPAGSYPRWASLDALVARTAAALRAKGVTSVTLSVDDSLFTGPAVSPAWPPAYLTSGVIAPVSALSLDQGRGLRAGRDVRVADPALTTGQHFAGLLTKAGIPVRGAVRRVVSAADAPVLASVESPPVPVLVEYALRTSDNYLAEALARLVARESGEPASFAGVAEALPSAVAGLGVPTTGLDLVDGSGLARSDRVSARTLAGLLAASASGSAETQSLRPLLSGLPVAGFTGTLSDRFGSGADRAASSAAGTVRAKTGTLTGVTSLAGTAYDASGRLLVFAALADQVPPGGTLAARTALDQFAASVAACGCS